MQNGITSVLPPNAAERVADSKLSAITMPGALACAMCTWLSMPPGSNEQAGGVDRLRGVA